MLFRSIAFEGPVRLLQGMRDEDVPWQHAIRIQERLTAADVRITLFKDGDHRLSSTAQLEELGRTVLALSRV